MVRPIVREAVYRLVRENETNNGGYADESSQPEDGDDGYLLFSAHAECIDEWNWEAEDHYVEEHG